MTRQELSRVEKVLVKFGLKLNRVLGRDNLVEAIDRDRNVSIGFGSIEDVYDYVMFRDEMKRQGIKLNDFDQIEKVRNGMNARIKGMISVGCW